MRLLGLLCIGLLLSACAPQALEKFTPKEDDLLARHFLEAVRTGNDAEIQSLLAPTLRGGPSFSGFRSLHEMAQLGTPLEIKEVGCNVFHQNAVRKTDLAYQMQFPHHWLIGDVLVETQGNTSFIIGSHFKAIPDSLEVLTRFSFIGKSPLEYIFLAVCVGMPCFVIFALIVCIRTPVRRKWLWILFIILPVVEFRLNWTTGKKDVQPLSLVLLAAGASKMGPYAPWILDFGLPVGALVFLLNRRRLMLPSSTSLPGPL